MQTTKNLIVEEIKPHFQATFKFNLACRQVQMNNMY